jgi:hypothetical protein
MLVLEPRPCGDWGNRGRSLELRMKAHGSPLVDGVRVATGSRRVPAGFQ